MDLFFFFKDHIRGRNDISQMRIILAVSSNLSITNTTPLLWNGSLQQHSGGFLKSVVFTLWGNKKRTCLVFESQFLLGIRQLSIIFLFSFCILKNKNYFVTVKTWKKIDVCNEKIIPVIPPNNFHRNSIIMSGSFFYPVTFDYFPHLKITFENLIFNG